MKRRWISLLLVALLFAILAMTSTIAEANDEIELVINDEKLALFSEPTYFDIPDEIELSFGESELPEIKEIGDIMLDTSLDDIEPTSISASGVVANDGDSGDFEIFNGILVKYNGSGGDVVIPYGVSTIGTYAFLDCYGVTSVTIPTSVTTICSDAFCFCSNMTNVNIPYSVTNIGNSAFLGCRSLTIMVLPDSIISIEGRAFRDCSGLTTITIPNGVTHIYGETFYGCTGLTSVIITKNVTVIEGSTFHSCTNLTDVTIESNNISIDDDCFPNCHSLTTFHTHCETPATKWARKHGYIVETTAHIPVTDPAVAPTCTETGLTQGSHCSVCGEIITTQETIPAKGHTKVTDKAVAPTCTETGLAEGSHCSVCGETIVAQETVPATGHTPVTDPAVAPTLTQTGLTEGSHCSVCGQVLVEQKVIPKLISMKNCTITGISDKTYTGKALTPAPVVKYHGNKLTKGTDYTVAYKNNKSVGTATVTITGKGKYGASINKTFKINPKPVALVSLTPGTKQLTVKWKKGASISGYEVQYSLKKSFASAKKVTITKAGTVNTVLKNLQPKKTYYVRIRTYKTVKGKKYYSTWSKAKSAKPTK